MDEGITIAISRWHEAVNSGDVSKAVAAVSAPIVVLGPKGAGPITPAAFADWVLRSGITLVVRSWHPVSDRLMVVEQDARWPCNDEPTRVATVFRVTGTKVSAALRLSDLKSALDLAVTCREMAETDVG